MFLISAAVPAVTPEPVKNGYEVIRGVSPVLNRFRFRGMPAGRGLINAAARIKTGGLRDACRTGIPIKWRVDI